MLVVYVLVVYVEGRWSVGGKIGEKGECGHRITTGRHQMMEIRQKRKKEKTHLDDESGCVE
jgi:hypothetical protein